MKAAVARQLCSVQRCCERDVDNNVRQEQEFEVGDIYSEIVSNYSLLRHVLPMKW